MSLKILKYISEDKPTHSLMISNISSYLIFFISVFKIFFIHVFEISSKFCILVFTLNNLFIFKKWKLHIVIQDQNCYIFWVCILVNNIREAIIGQYLRSWCNLWGRGYIRKREICIHFIYEVFRVSIESYFKTSK